MIGGDFWTPEERLGGAMDPLFEAELALLGAALLEVQAANMVAAIVSPEMFLEPCHGDIFSLITEALAHGQRPDAIVLAERLRGHKAFEELGGLRYLADMVDRSPPWPNAPDYARLVREGYQRRRLAELGSALNRAMKSGAAVDEILGNFEEQVMEVMSGGADADVVDAADAVDAIFEGLDDPRRRQTIATGIAGLDRALGGGLNPSHLLLLAGRPSMGKSALASSICLNVARNAVWPDGQRVGVLEVSAEMDVEQLARRHISDWALDLSAKDAPEYRSLKSGDDLTPEGLRLARHCGKELRKLTNLKMVFKPGLTLSALRGIARKQAAKWKRQGIRLGLVIVDHVGLMRDEGRSNGRYEAQTNLAIGMKELAGVLGEKRHDGTGGGVALVALAQLSRQIETRDNKRPMLNDLRDSGAWEENADAVVGVYRDAYYATREPKPKKHADVHLWEMRGMSQDVEAILLKLREGRTGTVTLWGDMGRNALRTARPDNYHDASGSGHLFDALDPDQALPASAPKSRFSDSAPAETGAAQGVEHGAEPGSAPPHDGPPEPPLSAYDDEEFA